MRHPLLVPDLRELIRDGETAALRDFFADHHPRRLAEIIDDLETEDGDALFRNLAAAKSRRRFQLPGRTPPTPPRSGDAPQGDGRAAPLDVA